MDPGESCDVPKAVLANTTDCIAGKATLEGMPTEVHWQILRNFLKSPVSFRLCPQDTYTHHAYGFGSLGILSVSKYFSTIGLSILYGENEFLFSSQEQDVEEFDDPKNYNDVEGPVSSSIIVFQSLLKSLTYFISSHASASRSSAGVI